MQSKTGCEYKFYNPQWFNIKATFEGIIEFEVMQEASAGMLSSSELLLCGTDALNQPYICICSPIVVSLHIVFFTASGCVISQIKRLMILEMIYLVCSYAQNDWATNRASSLTTSILLLVSCCWCLQSLLSSKWSLLCSLIRFNIIEEWTVLFKIQIFFGVTHAFPAGQRTMSRIMTFQWSTALRHWPAGLIFA